MNGIIITFIGCLLLSIACKQLHEWFKGINVLVCSLLSIQAAIKDAVNTDVHVPKPEKGQSKGALFALAAIGVGFFVAGTLAIR